MIETKIEVADPGAVDRVARQCGEVATGCTDAEAETAALDPSSKARRLYDYGGRFTQNVDGFKKGLALMDKFAGWYDDLAGDREAKLRDTPTKRNVNFVACSDKAKIGVEKFVFEELSVNGNIPLDAQNPEDIFGMEKNPAMQFVGRGYATSLSNSLAQMQPENNRIVRLWKQAGLSIGNASQSQAGIQLYNEYCKNKRCLDCPIGYYVMVKKNDK